VSCNPSVWWRWLLFVTCVFLFNWALLQVVKYGSASFMYVASAVTLPLTNVMATSALIMGGDQFTATITPFDFGSLACLIVGLLVYAVSDDEVTAPLTVPGDPAVSTPMSSDADAAVAGGMNTALHESDQDEDEDELEQDVDEDDDSIGADGRRRGGWYCCMCFDRPSLTVQASSEHANTQPLSSGTSSPMRALRRQRKTSRAVSGDSAASRPRSESATRTTVFGGKFGVVVAAPVQVEHQRKPPKVVVVSRPDPRQAYLARLGIGNGSPAPSARPSGLMSNAAMPSGSRPLLSSPRKPPVGATAADHVSPRKK
jgi:hypothetical protein